MTGHFTSYENRTDHELATIEAQHLPASHFRYIERAPPATTPNAARLPCRASRARSASSASAAILRRLMLRTPMPPTCDREARFEGNQKTDQRHLFG